MDETKRNRRLRLLIKRLNTERKKQAKKIDILCNDFIAAHRDFIKRLNAISFTADFYESVIGTTDLPTLFHTAGNLIKDQIPDANVAFFLPNRDRYELYVFRGDQPNALDKQDLESCFTCELVENICKSNRVCALDDMFAMGLEANLTRLSRLSAATIPLGQAGSSLGFILVYRLLQNRLTHDELSSVAAIAPGLSQAVQACKQSVVHGS